MAQHSLFAHAPLPPLISLRLLEVRSSLVLVHFSASDSPSPWFVARLSRSRNLPDWALRTPGIPSRHRGPYLWQTSPLRHMHIVFCPNHGIFSIGPSPFTPDSRLIGDELDHPRKVPCCCVRMCNPEIAFLFHWARGKCPCPLNRSIEHGDPLHHS
jgi:hypothetical protein